MNILKKYVVGEVYSEHLGYLMAMKMTIREAKRLIVLNKKFGELQGELVGARDKQLGAHNGEIIDGKLIFKKVKDQLEFNKKWEEYMNEPEEFDMEVIKIVLTSGQQVLPATLLVFEDIIEVQ